MNIIGLIPARGGSKRIPKKNIIDFDGKPLITYTIKAAIKSKIFSEVFVSTDDKEIAEISVSCGAIVPFLRTENCDDHSNVSDVAISFLNRYKKNTNISFDLIVLLLPNCPIRNETDIKLAYNNFKSKNLNFQISAFKFGWMNPWWAHTIEKNSIAKPLFINLEERSQDLPKLFCPTGSIWIANVKSLLKYKTFYGPDYSFFPINWKSAVDIDDYDDLEMALIIKKSIDDK